MSLDVVTACYAMVGVACIIGVWGAARTRRISLLRERANESISPNPSDSKGLAETIAHLTNNQVTAVELGTYSTMTVAEFAWS